MPFKKGMHFSEEHRRKISESRKANPHHPSTEFKKGHIPWTKNRPASEATREKISESKKGERNPNWKGGRTINRAGYVLVRRPDHPFAQSGGKIFEHRLIAEKKLGRFLKRVEVCHHKNGIPADNRPENIDIFPKGQHTGLHNSQRARRSLRKKSC